MLPELISSILNIESLAVIIPVLAVAIFALVRIIVKRKKKGSK